MPFVAQPTEKCTACGRTVYATEKTVVDDKEIKKVYHKTCIRCKECNKVLSLGQYSALDGTFYCKPHFKQLFASKGNYDDAFGKEKATAKWGESGQTSSIPPGSFIPDSRDDTPSSEKKQTSEATVALFKKFREEGDSNKCVACEKTVYLAEKLLVENKDAKLLFHKACFKCNVCNLVLDLRSYGSLGEKIYCKNHLKEVTGISSPSQAPYVPSQSSFVPATEAEVEKKSDKKETSEATAALFKKFREEGDSNRCTACDKTVYVAEKLLVENKNDKFLFHKACFKCCVCDLTLDLRNYGSVDDKIYCKNHLKEANATQRARAASGTYVPSSKSFIPEVKETSISEKGQTPDHIAAKFKGLGASGDKCKLCSKTVYATEKLVVEELKGQSIFHKSCFKCSHCNIQLDVSTFGSSGGKIFCKVHLKEFGKPEQAKDGGHFISPLATKNENYVPGARDEDAPPRSRSPSPVRSPQQDIREPESRYEDEPEPQREIQREQEPEPERQTRRSYDPEEEERNRKEEERNRRAEERRKQLEDEERKFEEERQRRKERLSQSFESADASPSNDSREEERRRKREEREKERLEEERKFQEEKEKREKEREERKKQREEEERREEEELQRRKREREERRKQVEEEAKREEEEAQRRAEERKKRLESLDS